MRPRINDQEAPKAALPLYQQLAETLKHLMEAGKIGAGEPMPGERELALTHHVSRDTVRKAIRLLEEQGLLYSDHGRGTFAAPAAVRQMSRFLDSFTADTIKRGSVPGQTILLMETVAANMALASLLHMQPDEPLLRIKRVRLTDGKPIGLQESFLRLPAGAHLEQEELERGGSLYRILIEKFGITPSESLESVGAVAAQADDAALLGVAPGTPLLLCERVMLSDRREPVEYCEMKYAPPYRYKSRISKGSAS
ncbi:GntR family transcriptional regulator [Massilia sp. S19_KUP03_FR1]|uniref:GntR family transcriptional regulator n=1 Tax=Massilia sp. S19_KUP03_FR1 TaxID=3025503 RepID=UPI002FCDA6C2